MELCRMIQEEEKVTWWHVAKACSYTCDNEVWLGFMPERKLFYAFIEGREIASKRQINAIDSLVKSLFKLEDPGEIDRAIEDALYDLGNCWDTEVDGEFIIALAVVAKHLVSQKTNGKPKGPDPDSMGEKNTSRDCVLMLAVGLVVAYLATLCWIINIKMSPAELTIDFAIGLTTLCVTDKATICEFLAYVLASKSNKIDTAITICDEAYAGTPKEKSSTKLLQ